METLRTPEERFSNLPGYEAFTPNYTEVADGEGGRLRIHHVTAGGLDPFDPEVVEDHARAVEYLLLGPADDERHR